jgi:clan AA aspartic protease
MIQGTVSAKREARIQITLRGPSGTELSVDAVIDTGFTGSLTLPSNSIAALGLRPRGRERALLADGSAIVLRVYRAAVMWDQRLLQIVGYHADGDALVGMSLLQGSELRIQVIDGGDVTVSPLTP